MFLALWKKGRNDKNIAGKKPTIQEQQKQIQPLLIQQQKTYLPF